MRKAVFALALFRLCASLAEANDCTCAPAAACATSAPGGWTNCGGVAPTAADSIHVTGGTVDLDTTLSTWKWIYVQSGTLNCATADTTNARYTLTHVMSPGVGNDTTLVVDPGATLNCDNKWVTFTWVPAVRGRSSGVYFQFGGIQGSWSPSDATIRFRGVQKAVTETVDLAEPAAFIDCMKGAAAPDPAALPGDTMVFTSGRSQDFWYKVSCTPSRCTGAGAPDTCCAAAGASAACSTTACGGGPCDYEITRNATDATPNSVANSHSWSSMVIAPGIGGPLSTQHPTPVDTNHDGTADPGGTLPAVGDEFVVFRPILLQGSDPATTKGITLRIGGTRLDMRYVELNKGNGAPTSDGTNLDGSPVTPLSARCTDMHHGAAQFLGFDDTFSPEGEIGFLNLHDFASGIETGFTHIDATDLRPNRPQRLSHWYIHDAETNVVKMCGPSGTICNGCDLTIGDPINMTIDSSTFLLKGVAFDGLHIARPLNGGYALNTISGAQGQGQDVLLHNVLIHDSPSTPGYGVNGTGFAIRTGAAPVVDGLAMWNLGRSSFPQAPAAGLDITPVDAYAAGSPPVKARVHNAFIVNVNTGQPGSSNDFASGADMITTIAPSQSSAGPEISDSYLANIVGSAGAGGRWYFNFIRNTNIELDNAPPCDATLPRAALVYPVAAVGNVITRSQDLSCMANGIYNGINVASAYTDRTWFYMNNLFYNLAMGADVDPDVPLNCIWIAPSGYTETRGVVAAHNICDLNGNTGGAFRDHGFLALDMYPGRLAAFYNIFDGLNGDGPNTYAIETTRSGSLAEGYNRFILVGHNPAVKVAAGPAAMAASDIDSDVQDAFVDRSTGDLRPSCPGAERARSPWGVQIGPIRFGIRDFGSFHPAVIPLLDPEAFRLRYNWGECGGGREKSNRRTP